VYPVHFHNTEVCGILVGIEGGGDDLEFCCVSNQFCKKVGCLFVFRVEFFYSLQFLLCLLFVPLVVGINT